MTIFPVTSSFLRRQCRLIFLWLNVWPLFLFLATKLWSWYRRPALFSDFFLSILHKPYLHYCIFAALSNYLPRSLSIPNLLFLFVSHFSQWCTSSFTEKGKQGSPILHIHIQIWSSGTQVMLLLSKTSIAFQTKYCQKKLHLRIFSLRSLHHKKCAICNIVDSQLNCIDYH